MDDHIPLKDEFSNDQSDIDIDDKDEEPRFYSAAKGKPINKKKKTFSWKLKWVKVPNSVPGSGPILIRRWVKIKLEKSEN